jgi:septal ring factor EnvC (AmiA/AmiB activator)
MLKIKKLLFFAALFTVFSAQANHSKMLENINQKISSIKSDLTQQQTQKTKFENDMEHLEQQSAELTKKLHLLHQQLSEQQTKLKSFEDLQTQDQTKIDHEKKQMLHQIKNTYLFSRQPYLKMLLSQQNTASFSRMLMYYHYFYQQQNQEMQTIQMDLQQAHNNQVQMEKQITILHELKLDQQQEQHQLKTTQHKRNILLHSLNHKIENEHHKLAELLHDKQQLEKTVLRLMQKESLQVSSENSNLDKNQRRLPWPTHGTITHHFGETIEQSELHWNGVLIKANEGQPVYSVSNGTVVFAKWLAGYGLLMIINHGHGFMTLYGRNQALYKKTGDSVHAGELISRVGETGGFESPGLYFSILHNAQPLNPADWCQ